MQKKKTMRPSRCNVLQPQEELQVAIRPHHHIAFSVSEVASTKSNAYFVFVFLVSFVVVVVVAFVVAFVPVVPLNALP